MLNFRNTSIALFIFAAIALILLFSHIRLGMFPLLAITIWLILLITGSVNIRSGFYLKAFCKGKTSEKKVALTFDDGPDELITPKVLAILEKHNVPATFFIIGKKAEKNADLLLQIIAKGHLAGLHSYGHAFFFDLYGRGRMEADLLKAERIMTKAAGKRPLLFRPPYGVTNPVLSKVISKLGYRVIGWSVWSRDTSMKDAERMAERVIRKLHPGAVILMHDTQNVTPEALEKVIIRAKEEGYSFAGLDEILNVEAFEN